MDLGKFFDEVEQANLKKAREEIAAEQADPVRRAAILKRVEEMENAPDLPDLEPEEVDDADDES